MVGWRPHAVAVTGVSHAFTSRARRIPASLVREFRCTGKPRPDAAREENGKNLAKLWAIVMALSFLVILWVALVYDLITFDVNY
jgi:ABC-type Fe3+ transport system permease subunit